MLERRHGDVQWKHHGLGGNEFCEPDSEQLRDKYFFRREHLSRKAGAFAAPARERHHHPDANARPRPAEFFEHLAATLGRQGPAIPLGQGAFPISPAGILQTAAALEAVFKSVDADGAWMTV